MTTRAFWRHTLERAFKSFAQGCIVGLGIAGVGDAVGNDYLDAFTVDWGVALGVGLGMAILSVLTSIVSTPFGPADDPSVVA